MRLMSRSIAGLVLAGALLPAAAIARQVSVQVDAKAGPWVPSANRKMPFGIDAGAPVLVKLPDLPGAKIAIYADGTTRPAGGGAVDARGVEDKAVDDGKGPRGKVYPSLYSPKILYPANLHALVAVFVDGAGLVVGRPFLVGDGVRVAMPDGADALSLGFNDVAFAANSGALTVTVELPDD